MTINSPLPSQIHGLKALWCEAFGDDDEFIDMFFAAAFKENRCRCLTVNDTVASALYWFDCSCRGEKIAYLYAVATSKAYRGKGLCSALMENTHRHLESLGYAGAVLVPSTKELFDFYARLGYTTYSHVGKLCCNASKNSLKIRRIDADEYARLRRRLLPDGGVIQEKENLTFLQAQATLFAGDGFILAAHGEADTLYGTELLGDLSLAPDIANSLGYAKGCFRTVGNDLPFAAYRPLGDKDLPTPSYFGLAFD